MANTIIVRSRGAIALGAIFTLGTAAVLFSDARHWSDLSTDHLVSGLVLLGTIASGHMFWQQLRAFRLFPAAGLALLFIGGTGYCVTTSAARNVENSVPKLLETLNLNEQRKKLEADIADAKSDLRKATDAVTKECSGGEGPFCLAKRKVQDRFDSHYWMLVARLANMKPAQPTNAGLAHAAKVFVALPFTGTDPEAIEQKLALFMPFARALFLEVATIVFFGIGFSHRKGLPAPRRRRFFRLPRLFPRIAGNRPKPLMLSGNRWKSMKILPPISDLEIVMGALARAKRPVSNIELASLMGCSPGEACKRVSGLNGRIRKERAGRHVWISSNEGSKDE